MKILKRIPVLGLLLVGLMTSCSNDSDSNSPTVANSIYETAGLNLQKSSTGQSTTDFTSNPSLDAVNLGVAANFAILSKTGITDVYKSTVTGDVGASPITGAAILLKCDEVTGTIFSVDAAGPACKITDATRLTTAIGDMQIAYTNAAGRVNPDFLNLGAGTIGGKTLTPGLYKWTSTLNIPTDITISGSPTDVWIFQVSGNLNMSSSVRITLSGGAQAKNIFWQTSGAVTLGSTSHFEGNILSQTGINLKTGASINGRMMAQTAVTLQMNTVTIPQ
jgi:hypothetical protein